MKIAIISLFPENLTTTLAMGVVGRAIANKTIELTLINPREFSNNVHNTIDDRPFGGGPGMVMLAEPLYQAITSAKQKLGVASKVYYLSPQGKVLNQEMAVDLSQQDSMILLCGRYEGVDERLIEKYVDAEISLGDYVLSGGELAACVVVDVVGRLLPGVLGHVESSKQDSFSDGLLDCPHYTRPEIWQDSQVPKVLLSGNHAKIAAWRKEQALARTQKRRPDLFA